MAPPSGQKTKSTKPSGGTDIRSFFGDGNALSSSDPKQASNQKATNKSISVIDVDNDITSIPLAQPPTSGSKRKRRSTILDSDEDEPYVSPPAKKAASPKPARPRRSEASPVAVASSSKASRKSDTTQNDAVESKRPTINLKSRSVKTEVSRKSNKRNDDDDFVSDGTDEDEEVPRKTTKLSKPKSPAKPYARSKPSPSAPLKQSTPQAHTQTIGGSSSGKFNWAAAKAAKLSGPAAPGSKPLPNGEPNCLAGLSFVFTGELSSITREEAIDLAKRFGGRVTGQPSSVTNFVVLGENAGPAKIKAIEKHKLKTLSEDEFLNLIATRKGVLDEKTKAKMEKEEKKIREAARELELAEKRADKAAAQGKGSTSVSQLWTVRYAPQSLKEVVGNKGQIEKLQAWLHDWSSSLKAGFKKPGKNGLNIFRAVMITGSPGIGKTTSAHLCAKLEGYTPIELNASDARSKKLVESGTNINNTSLDGWMGGASNATNTAGIAITDKTCLIMDEVDGMSAGDRGGVGALTALIKKTRIPIICIANDRNAQKLKPLLASTGNLTFRKPEASSVRSRILTIAFKEKMKIPANVVDQLVAGAQSDIRQVVNMLSTWKLSSDTMSFDESKELAKDNEKYTVMTPFNVINKLMGPYLFSPNARETLNDKMELYFHDHSFVPLFVQENYLKTEPAKIRNLSGPEKVLQQLQLMDRAASSISDGDLVDALIHGPEQHWSLMPLHAVTSTVRPASFLYGNGAGYAGPMAMTFPQWLGQNSKQSKLTRQLGDVQIKMRLRVSGDKSEIRQSYVPSLFPVLVQPLIENGASAVDGVIERMDSYFLSKEEWDTIVELGLDDHKDIVVMKGISTATKTSLTKKYNSSDHPIAFHKAQEFAKPKKLPGGPIPDLEDILDVDDEVMEDEPEGDDDDDDISKDKIISQPKGKKKGSTKSGKSGNAKK